VLSAVAPAAITFSGASNLQNAGSVALADDTRLTALDALADRVVNLATGSVTYGGSAVATVAVPFWNHGTVQLAGTAKLQVGAGGPSSDTGSYDGPPGTTVEFTGHRTLASAPGVAGGTAVAIDVTGSLTAAAPLTVSGLQLSGGTFTGSANVSTSLKLGAGTLAGGTVTLGTGGSAPSGQRRGASWRSPQANT